MSWWPQLLVVECCGGCCDVDACEEPRATTEHVPLWPSTQVTSPTMNMFLNILNTERTYESYACGGLNLQKLSLSCMPTLS